MDNQQQIQVQPLLYKNNNSINSLPNQKTPNQGDYNENFQTQKRQSQNSDSQNQDSQTKNVQNNNNNNKNRFVSGNQFQSQKANQQQKQQQQRYEQKQKISARNSQSSQNTDNNNNNQNNNNDKNNDKNNSQNNNSQVYLNQDFKKIQYDFLESETENQEEEKMLQELKQLMKEIQIEFKLGLAREGLQKAIEIIYRAEKELNSVHYQEIFEDLIKQLNYSSIDVLNYGFLDHALIVLNQCDQLIENNPMDHIELKVLTLNHLGCIYRRGNSFEQAFSCLNNAQQLVYQNQLKEYAGLTYLNLSALFSQVGNHNSALDNAQKAKTLQLQEFEEYLKNQSEQEKLEYNFDKNNKNPAQNYLQNQDYLNKATTLIICHHNIASELEYFQQLDEALQNYEESCKLAQSHLGYIHPITQTFRQEYQDFQIRYAQKKISDQNKRFRDKIQDRKQRDIQYIDLVSSLVQGGYAKNSNNFRKILIKKNKKNGKSFSKKSFQQLMNQEQNRQRKQIYLQKQPEIQFQKQQISSQNTSFKTNFQRSRPLTGQKSAKNSNENKLILDGIYSPNQRQQMFQKTQNQNINQLQYNKRLIRPSSSTNFRKELNFFNSSNSKNFDIFNPNSQNNNAVSQNNSYFSTFQLKPHTSNTTPKNQFMTQKNLANSIQSNKTKSLKPLSMDYNIYNKNKQSQNQNQNEQQQQFQSRFFQTSQNKKQQEKNVSQNQVLGQNLSQNQSASRTKLLSSLKYQYQVCQQNMKSIEEKIIFELEKQEKNKQLAQNQKILQLKAKPNQFIIHQKNSSALQKPYDFQIILQKFDAKIPYLQEKKEESGRIQVAMSIQKSQIEIQFIPKDLQQQKLSHFLNISDLINNIKNSYTEASPSNCNKKITNISQKFSELILQCLMINRENQKLVINLESPKSKLQVDTEQVPATIYIESQNLTLEIIQKNQNNTILLLQQSEENSNLKEDEISQIQPIFAKNYLEEKEQQENQSSQNQNQKEKEDQNENKNKNDSEDNIQPIFSTKKQEAVQNENTGKQEADENENENEYEDEIYDEDDFEKTEEQSLNPKSSQNSNSNYNYNYQNGKKLDQVVKKTTSQTVKQIQFDNYNDQNQKKSSEVEKLQQNVNEDLVKQEQQIKVESNYNFKPFKQQKKTLVEPKNQQENKQQVKNEEEQQSEDYQQDSFIKEQNDSNINSQQFNSSQILVKRQENNQLNLKVDENKSENEELVKTLNIKKQETQNSGIIDKKENEQLQDQKEEQNQNVDQIKSQNSSQNQKIQENNSSDKINTETQKTQEEQQKNEKFDQNNDDLTLQQQEDKELEQAAQLIQKKFRQQQENKQKQSKEQGKLISQNSDEQKNFQERKEGKKNTLQSQNEEQDNQSDKKELSSQNSGNLSENNQKQEEKQSENGQNSGSNSDSEKSKATSKQISNTYQAHSIASSYLTSLNFAVLNQVRNSQPKIQFQKQLEQIQQNQNYNLNQNLSQNQSQEKKTNTISSQNSDQNQEEGDLVEQQAKNVVSEYLLTLNNTVLKQVELLLQKKEKENVLKIDHNQPIPPLRQHITEQDEETERSQQQSQINYVQNLQQQQEQQQNFYDENKLTTQMSELQDQNSLENENQDQNRNKEKQQGNQLELEQEKAAAYIQKIYREKKQGQNLNLGENSSKQLENPQITVESSEFQRENNDKMQEINKNNINNDDSQQEEEEEDDDDDGNVQVQLQKGSNKNILIKKNNLNKLNKRAANAQYHF